MAKKLSSPKARRSAESAPVLHAPSAFRAPSDQVERGLVTGEDQGLLEDYFGRDAYRQLRDLALSASTRSVRGGPRVLILPGIMGSTLARKGLLGREDTLWVDPIEIALGRLTELKLGGTPSPYFANGVILLSYLKLKLRLKIAGYDADFFPYDWRQSVIDSGASLSAALQKEAASEVQLVAHSMGGLVARAAMASAAGSKVKRLIMLGTPNYGSYAILQALRGTFAVVRSLCKVDRQHTPEQLAGDVFASFPGLHEMIPGKCETVNLYDPAAWPASEPHACAERLGGVKKVLEKLAPADQRFYLIAGVNQQTTIGVRMESGEFTYDYSPDGDGTVPLACARLEGIPPSQTWFVEEQHGNLPNHGKVESAVIDLLAGGTTQALASVPPAVSRSLTSATEASLRAVPPNADTGTEAYRHLLDGFVSPLRGDVDETAPATAAAAASDAPASAPATLQNLVIGRRRQRRLEITLANGSLTEADSPAYVLGVFRSVAPSGAAKAIDERLDGAISDFAARRIFSGDVGELFTLPAARSRLPADLVVFAGLGAFDKFNPDVHQLVAENAVRMLVRSHVTEFATVLIGAGTGQSIPAVVQNLLTGFLRALNDTDPRHRFRGVTLCETNPARYAEMKAAVLRIAGTTLFDDVELTLDEMKLPPPTPSRGAAVLAGGAEPIYTMIRQENSTDSTLQFQVSVLGSGMKAAVVSLPQSVDAAKLDDLLKSFDAVAGTSRAWDIATFGAQFAELMLPVDVRNVLTASPDRHLVLVHDAKASRIPWETMTIGGWTPSVTAGLSRRYLAENLPIATWLEQRRAEPTLKLLLIVDPTENLDGARSEGDRLLRLAGTINGLEVTELRGERATKPAVLSALRSGKYDIVHYAGHAYFDEDARGSAGLLLWGESVLSGSDLAGASNLPFLVFFNACQAGRVRGGKTRGDDTPAATSVAQRSYSVAETMMCGGISNYLSTYWPVGDNAAETFAATFYQGVLNGSSIGAALLDARKAVQQLGARDWADYILYGSYDFILKRRS